MTLAVEVEDVFRVYATDEGTAAALQGLSLTVHEGEVVAVLGTERLRQDDAAPDPGRSRSSLRGPGSRGRSRPAPLTRPWARPLPEPPARLRGPALHAGARTGADGRRAHFAQARAHRRVVLASGAGGRPSCSARSASRTASTPIRTSSPAANSSGSRYVRRSPTARNFCSPTSRRASSTRKMPRSSTS